MSGISAELMLTLGDFELDACFDAPSAGVTALFGASGCGKSTLLRCIAGLEKARGSLRVNDQVWQHERMFLPTHRRALGYVFQEASLFPHLSVRANLEYGYRRIPPSERRMHPDQVAEWLGLQPLLDRTDPARLSGGERQRVAIGRALLTSPRLLLMDEPLSALDNASRQEIMCCLERLHRELEVPVIYVSHTLDEVARLADHLLLMERGKIVACGDPIDMLSRLDLPLASFDDAGAAIEAVVVAQDEAYQLTRLAFPGGALQVGRIDLPQGARVRVRVRARDVSIATAMPLQTSICNIFDARILDIRDEGGDSVNVRLAVGETGVLISRITRRSRDLLALSVGMSVYAQVKSVALM